MQVEIFFILDWITYSIIVQVLLEINISINIFLYWQAIKTSLIMTDTYISLLVSQSVGLFYLFILKDWRFDQQEQVVLTLFLRKDIIKSCFRLMVPVWYIENAFSKKSVIFCIYE